MYRVSLDITYQIRELVRPASLRMLSVTLRRSSWLCAGWLLIIFMISGINDQRSEPTASPIGSLLDFGPTRHGVDLYPNIVIDPVCYIATKTKGLFFLKLFWKNKR